MLTCPCGKEIDIETEYGVKVYKHTDTGNYCKRMNMFQIDMADMIGNVILKSFKAKDMKQFSCYCVGQPPITRAQLYQFIASKKESSDELAAIFKLLFSDDVAAQIKRDITKEMVLVFGASKFRQAVDATGVFQDCVAQSYSDVVSKEGSYREVHKEFIESMKDIKHDLGEVKLDAMRKVKAEEIFAAVDQAASQFISNSTSRRGKIRKALDDEIFFDWGS